ncbi:hypothetical protein EXIGLDRAFT_740819 [Exidia glandulosa HHB12029]|uniref:L-methionine transporter n=1 Tax=Exidia glandulosa HHB12029 TaxID=1314781 RepID=A0A165GAI0_EXIGL|nr:hypothetical protein EXIGLDRAFT_740819 [Exidia glandulosa HHB12029]
MASSSSSPPMREGRASKLSYPPSPPRSSRSSSDSDSSLRRLELAEGPEPLLTRHARSNTLSTPIFEFHPELLPLSLSESQERSADAPAEKTVGLIKGIGLVVGLQIGSGIFSSPGVVAANVNSVGAALSVWAAGGLLAWSGASSFAELGSAIPLNGGAQAYLAYAYNPLVSYLYAWTAISTLKPGGNAIIALIFGEYMNRLFFHATRADVAPDAIPAWAIKLTACAAILIVTALCAASSRLGTSAMVVFTTVKIAALLAITVLGLVKLLQGHESPALREPLFEGTTHNPSSFALALYSALWAFDGWDQANYIGGELINPGKTFPRVIHTSMTLVMFLFLAANLSYFVLLDKATVARSNTVALDFGRALMGPVGAIIFSGMVAFSCIGALNGAAFTTSRLIYVAGREGFLPAIFGRLNGRTKTPVNALILQALLTIIFILVGGGFRSLVNFYSVANWLFLGLTVMGVVVLRIKEPTLERPYKTFITTPLLFSAVALFLLCMPIVAAPLEALAAFAFILVGVPLYFLTQKPTAGGDNAWAVASSWVTSFFSQNSARRRGGYTNVSQGEDTVEMSRTYR